MYGRDLAFIQHAGFGDFARRAAPGLLAMLRAAGIRSGTVLDLGCGAGVWLRALQRAGYTARGIDASPDLARIARRTAPGARVEVGSVHGRALPRCDAITALGEVLAYVPTGGRRAPDLRRLFARAFHALTPGGLLVFDVIVAGRPLDYRTFRTGEGWAVLAEVRDDPPHRRLVRDITTFRAIGRPGARGGPGDRYRRVHERHVLQVPARREVESALRAAGFTVAVRRGYGRFSLSPRHRVFRARRP